MVGKNKDTDFKIEDYEKFYEHHTFEPINEKHAFSIHEYIPRFGWAFDQVEELSAGRDRLKLLDLGCLDGSFALTVAKHLGIYAHGIDLTKDGIDIANQRAEQVETPTRFTQGTIEQWLKDIALSHERFDFITMFEVIEHVKDVPEVLRLIDHVLKPGGSVLVSTPAFESPVYGLDDEKNKCHIRLYTTAQEDYERENKYGHVRKATSIYKEIGADRIKDVAVHNHLINVRYQ